MHSCRNHGAVLWFPFKSFIRLLDENSCVSVLLSIWQILGTCSYIFYTMHKHQSQMQRNVLIVDRTQGHKDPVFIAFMLTIKHDGPGDCPWSFLKRHLRNADKYLFTKWHWRTNYAPLYNRKTKQVMYKKATNHILLFLQMSTELHIHTTNN